MSSNHIKDSMRVFGDFPTLDANGSLKAALDLMTSRKIGMVCIVNQEGELLGVLSDGDLRRLILTKQSPLPALLISNALDFGVQDPVTCLPTRSLEAAIKLMKEKKIWDLPVVGEDKKLVGLLHLHDVI